MKEFLLVLFYQAIVAVNAAVILSAIVWLAKRKEEKDERKPNPDFTPQPEKKPEVELRSALIRTVNGEKFAQRWYAPDEQIPRYAILQGEPYKFFAEMDKDGGKLVEFVRIKPPTTGTNVIEPKPKAVEGPITQCEYCRFYTGESPDCGLCDIWNERVWAEMTCIEFKPKARTDNHCFDCKKFSWMKPSSDVGCYLPFCNNISCFLDDDPHEFSCSNHAKMEQKEINMRETIHEDEMRKEDAKKRKHDELDAVAKFLEACHKFGSAGASTTDEIVEKIVAIGEVNAASAKEIADALDRTDKKPVTPERMKEAGFEVEPVIVYNLAEESADTYFLKIPSGIGNKVVDTVKMRCGSCRWHDDNGLCHCEAVCNPEKLPYYAAVKRHGDHLPCKHWRLGTITDNHGKELPAQTTHICKNCKHYLATDEEAATGLCGMKDEITFGRNYSACFEKREEKDHE